MEKLSMKAQSYRDIAGDAKKLYAFMYPSESVNMLARKGVIRVKIGETIVEVDDRISGQTKGSGQSEKPMKLWDQNLKGMAVSSDHQVHKMLVENGMARRVERDDKKSTEWFDFVAPSSLVKLVREEDDDEKVAAAIKVYMADILSRAVTNVNRMLQTKDEVYAPIMIARQLGYHNWFARKLFKQKDWYNENIMPLDMVYADKNEKWNQPYIMGFDLMVKILDKAELCRINQPKILVVEAIEIACVLLHLGYNASQISFTSTSERKRNDAEKRGIFTLPADVMINLYKKGNFAMKFDACLMNPPYEQGLHIDFVNLGVAVADRTVAVHPATPIITRKDVNRSDRDIELVSSMKKYESSCDLYDGVELFSAAMEMPISVTAINKSVMEECVTFNGEIVNSAEELNPIGAWANKFYCIISDDNLHVNTSPNNIDEKFWVNQCWKRNGAFSETRYHTMIVKEATPEDARSNNTGWMCWAFDTKEEAENFIAYCKTKFARFMLALYKLNGNIHRGELVAVPWMDFTQQWDDEKLFKHFKISLEDQQKICEFIPDYY